MITRSMFFTALGILAIAIGPLSHSVCGAEATAAQPVARLIARLGSDQFSEREAASQALDAMGPSALEALRKAINDPDMEVQRRARTLVAKIGKRVERERILAPKLVRLKYDDVRLDEAVADFAKQSGYSIVLNGPKSKWGDRRVTLDTGEVPFWEALDRFCKKASLKAGRSAVYSGAPAPAASGPGRVTIQPLAPPVPLPGGPVPIAPGMPIAVQQGQVASVVYDSNYGTRRIVLNDGVEPNWPTCVHGAARFRAIPKGQAQRGNGPWVSLEVETEPRLHVRRIVDLTITKAEDEHGQILKAKSEPSTVVSGPPLPPNAASTSTVTLQASFPERMVFPVRFQAADKSGKMLKSLKGTLSAETQTPTEQLLTVDKLMEAANTEVKGEQGEYLKVLEASKGGNGLYHLRVQLQIPATIVPSNEVVTVNPRGRGRQHQMIRTVSVYGLSVFDDQGEPLLVRSTSSVARVFGNVATREYSLMFAPQQGQGAPAKLVFAGQRILSVDIPFELKDVPLNH